MSGSVDIHIDPLEPRSTQDERPGLRLEVPGHEVLDLEGRLETPGRPEPDDRLPRSRPYGPFGRTHVGAPSSETAAS